ncbi:MAG: NAD(P)H-hydrate dehydratase [Opitutaceae bacterium]
MPAPDPPMMDADGSLPSAFADPILSCAEARRWEADLLADDDAATWKAMQAAGRAVGASIFQDLQEVGLPTVGRILVLVGKGHNGGDALIALSTLLERKPEWRALIVLSSGTASLRPLTRRALEMLDLNRNPRIELAVAAGKGGDRVADSLSEESFDLCLDGLLGMAFKPPLSGATARIIEWVNRNPGIALRAAVDLPSGIGDASDPGAFRADFTYATGIVKRPVVLESNRDRVGRFRYLDLGFFRERRPTAESLVLKDAILDPLRALRPPATDKRSFGHVFVLTGSRPYPGALLMAVRAALQSGAGLVTAFAPESLAAALPAHAPEAIWVPWPETLAGSLALEGRHLLVSRRERCGSLVMGPGLGREEETLRLVAEADRLVDVPVALDADALQKGLVDELAGRRDRVAPLVLTPHAGEFARIAEEDPNDRSLLGYSQRLGVITCLKGPVTRISNGNRIYLSPYGGPVLARGGSGDLLAGILGTALAGCPGAILEATCRAVVWHGRAADLLARSRGPVAVRTGEVLDFLSPVLRRSDHGC